MIVKYTMLGLKTTSFTNILKKYLNIRLTFLNDKKPMSAISVAKDNLTIFRQNNLFILSEYINFSFIKLAP